jgi:hypothetical protein
LIVERSDFLRVRGFGIAHLIQRVQPHRSRSFKLSTDPFFIEKLRDVVGLYLNPPETPWFCA